jgi:hypothetical protein
MTQARFRLKEAAVRHLYSGKLLKEFVQPGCDRGTIARLADRCGFKRYFLRPEEFAEVMARRKERGLV